MCVHQISITVPEDLVRRLEAWELNPSAICTGALQETLEQLEARVTPESRRRRTSAQAYVRTKISYPQDLHRRLRPYYRFINRSQICSTALEAAVSALEALACTNPEVAEVFRKEKG